jgi:glycosyltransferase involved in cell wall biosynthesis
MLTLARDPELRRALGAKGRERVRERFGCERMVDETLAVYASLAVPAGVQARRSEVR